MGNISFLQLILKTHGGKHKQQVLHITREIHIDIGLHLKKTQPVVCPPPPHHHANSCAANERPASLLVKAVRVSFCSGVLLGSM
jgi:hypothetical protein